jgi:hypothetical protein
MYRTYIGEGWYRSQRLRAMRDARMGSVLSNNAFLFPQMREALPHVVDRGSVLQLEVLQPGFTVGTAQVTKESSTIETG